MKIYTKSGDRGETSLLGGDRVPKDSIRIRTYGAIDELNAILGLVLAEEEVPDKLQAFLGKVQSDLFFLGAELATPRGKTSGVDQIEGARVQELESEIDLLESFLPPLKTFVLPGGTRVSAFLHLARTVSRRAEREIIILNRAEPLRPEVLEYINRLSDFLFVCARFGNHQAGVKDRPWSPSGR